MLSGCPFPVGPSQALPPLRDIVQPDGSVMVGDAAEQERATRAQLRDIVQPDGSVTVGDAAKQERATRALLRDIVWG